MAKRILMILAGGFVALLVARTFPFHVQPSEANSEIIPPERRIEWTAGIPGGIPDLPVLASVKDFGAKGDGVTDDTEAITRAIASMPSPGVLLIPAGTYLIRSRLTIAKSVVLRGEGTDKTHLIIDQREGPAITIQKIARGSYINLTGGYARGSTALTVSDATALSVGSWVEIQQDNDPQVMYTRPDWNQDFAQDAVGQLARIAAISGNVVTIDEPLRLDYSARLRPRIRMLGFVERAGVERLHLVRRDRSENHMIVLREAAYSWVREVESEYAYRVHVGLYTCYRCEVRDSYFHHAGDYGGGGHGYGVSLGGRATNSLVENNIFRHLRHAMLVQLGATGNVIAYNYSLETRRNEAPTQDIPDISLHGHFPNFNLFEGNVVQEIHDGDYWGPSGPGNTFLRNRVETDFLPEGRGIRISDSSHRQNVVGNEVVYGGIYIDRSVQETLLHANIVRGRISWNQGIAERDIPASYYLRSKPEFYGSMAWPSIGADRPNGTNPAKERYKAGIFIPSRR